MHENSDKLHQIEVIIKRKHRMTLKYFVPPSTSTLCLLHVHSLDTCTL